MRSSRDPVAGAGSVYFIEALASTGSTLLSVGIFFYTAHRFGWGAGQNFALAAVQGIVYVVGALLAGRMTARVPHRTVLALLYAVMAAVSGVGVFASGSAAAVAVIAVGYSFLAAIGWPILESLACEGADSHTLARRLGIYNLVWPAVGVVVFAGQGAVIEYWPRGVFLLAAVTHVLCAVLAFLSRTAPEGAAAACPPAEVPDLGVAGPELVRLRTVALWVSRIALPATYAVIYGLMPLMPFLPALRRLDAKTQTVVGSTWMVSRFIAFGVLAMTAWWHTRPRIMVAAAAAMLVAFLGVTLPPSLFWPRAASPAVDLAAIVLWQLLLGFALGVIYSGSLYFGMVLSEGSTDHGGYHEALIGVGWVLGPAVGAAALWARPGDVAWGAAAVGGVIAVSVLAVVVAGALVGRKPAAATV